MSIRLLMKALERTPKNSRYIQPPPLSVGDLGNINAYPKGTTIVAVEYNDGIAMAADRIATLPGGTVFSRDFVKLENVQENAALAFCGNLALAHDILKDFKDLCDRISSEIMRPISLDGKCSLLKSAARVNFTDIIWIKGSWDFGAILGGYDHVYGKAIYSFNAPLLLLHQHDFWADGSGFDQARTFLHHNFQKNLNAAEAVALALGAIRAAGVFETSVSHPYGDPPPTVKLIDKNGIIDISEKNLDEHRKEARKMEISFRNNTVTIKVKRTGAARERRSR